MIMSSSSVTTSMAEFDFLVSFLQGLWLAKIPICSILVGHGRDYQCHSETTSNQPYYQFEVQLLGLGPCGFPSFWISDVQYEVLFRGLLIMTTVKHPDKARM